MYTTIGTKWIKSLKRNNFSKTPLKGVITHMNEPWEDLSFRVTVTANNAEQRVNHHRQPVNCGKDVRTHLGIENESFLESFLCKRKENPGSRKTENIF